MARVTLSSAMLVTLLLKWALISPFLMRLLMSGRIQYLTWRCISAPRWTRVTFAPWRHRSSAAMAAEFLPPITSDIEAVEGVGLVVVVLHLAEIFAGDSEVVGQVVVAGGDDELASAMMRWRGRSGLMVWTVKLPSEPSTRSTCSYWRMLSW